MVSVKITVKSKLHDMKKNEADSFMKIITAIQKFNMDGISKI